MIAFLQIQRFYVRTLGLESHQDPVIVTKNKAVLDLNIAAEQRRVNPEMSARDAKASLMGGVFREWNEDDYVEAQRSWLDLAVDFSDVIEPDEQHSAWIDLSKHPDPIATYRSMVEAIPYAHGGLSTTKWLSKLSARIGDQNLDAVFEIQRFLSQIPVHQVAPISLDQAARLEFLGYPTCGKAMDIPLEVLQKQFGKNSLVIWNAIRGGHSEGVQPRYPEKSVADRYYFREPVEDLLTVDNALLKLADRISARLQDNDLFGASMKLTIEHDGSSREALRTFTKPLHDRRSVYFSAKRLFDSIYPDEPITAVRIALPDLQRKVRHQETIDRLAAKEKQLRADTAVRCVRNSYGDTSIKLGSDIQIPRRQLVLKEWRNATGWI